MANKVIIGILVLLLILMGGIGYYSYTLSQQIDYLGERLTVFEAGQTAQIEALGNELITLRKETTSSISTLEDKIGETQAEINTLKEDIGLTRNQISGLEDEIDGVTSQIEDLDDRLTGAVTEFSHSVMDAGKVYQKVIQATVRISDGQVSTFGSGFIFDNEAHVVTNHHVVNNLSEMYVSLHDGRVLKATLIGSSDLSDIAVLKLEDNPGIEPVLWADSSLVKIGEPVAAIGDPFGLRDTITTGVLSQINRLGDIPNLLQFDAAVNPGNSGGPLANSRGEIIGVVVSRIPPESGDGIYYAIAANKAKRVAEAIIEHGHFDYPWLGIGITDLTPQIAQDRDLETTNGVLIVEVYEDDPAEVAGIKVDDIIVSIDNVPIKDKADLISYLGEFMSPGDAATIGLMRGTTRLELHIEVGSRQP